MMVLMAMTMTIPMTMKTMVTATKTTNTMMMMMMQTTSRITHTKIDINMEDDIKYEDDSWIKFSHFDGSSPPKTYLH